MTTLMIVAGEASGDLHGAEILSVLKELCPDLRIVGVGGKKMSQFLDKKLADVSDLGVVGFFEVVRHLPKILRLEKQILEQAEEENASVALLIDYQSFNLRLAKSLRKRRPSMLLCQYVCPQVWAWKANRIPKLGSILNILYCLFDFEPPLFKDHPVEAICLGHPLVDLVKPDLDRDSFIRDYSLVNDKPIVALLPGSRMSEITRLLPAMLEMVRNWDQSDAKPVQWVLPVASTLDPAILKAAIGDLPIHIIEERNSYSARAYADAALVCSGTATLETAILGTPFAILYRMNPFTLAMARRLVKIDHFGLANVVAGRQVARELLQEEVSPAGLHEELLRLLEPANSVVIRQDLAMFKERLGEAGAAERVARHLASKL
ncbi:MAG: lipid-A-disaccharide synthase [Holophagaceae bacterium]|nr:lipid-A-disaccharide synthase [Holophagaceae bacterium]